MVKVERQKEGKGRWGELKIEVVDSLSKEDIGKEFEVER